jgi:uncharacterized membrane protein YkvA (DUF1232 family)
MRTLKALAYVAGALFGAIYILNPTAGVFELLPDNLPIVGNLDEAAMVTLLIACLRGLRRLRDESRQIATTPVGSSGHERRDFGVHVRDDAASSLL